MGDGPELPIFQATQLMALAFGQGENHPHSKKILLMIFLRESPYSPTCRLIAYDRTLVNVILGQHECLSYAAGC
jgi:hypothetical protein